MKVRETFYSMKCDCCGQMLDDENYYPENELGAIGDEMVDGHPYSEIVEIARDYIQNIGGFEEFAAWGLIRLK